MTVHKVHDETQLHGQIRSFPTRHLQTDLRIAVYLASRLVKECIFAVLCFNLHTDIGIGAGLNTFYPITSEDGFVFRNAC